MENKVRFGLKNFNVAPLTFTTDASHPMAKIPSFGTYTHIPGAVSIAINPEGETTQFYADDTKYYVSALNNGYSGTVELAYLRNEDYVLLWGDTDNSGTLVETADVGEQKHFAMAFEFMNDQARTRHVIYDVTFERAAINSSTTTDTKEPQTTTLNFTAVPLPAGLTGTGGTAVRASRTDQGTAGSPDTVYNGWFDSVWYDDTPYTP